MKARLRAHLVFGRTFGAVKAAIAVVTVTACSNGCAVDLVLFDTGSAGESDASESNAASASDGPGSSSEANEQGPSTDASDTTSDAATESSDTGPLPSCARPSLGAAAPPACEMSAPGASFAWEVQWSWSPSGPDTASFITPLVMNLDDDNNDGEIDLCDTPDVVVVTADPDDSWPSNGNYDAGHIYVLNGDDGSLNFEIPNIVDHTVTPALGDIDGDGFAEIVTASNDDLLAFNHDGSLLWSETLPSTLHGKGIALADLDADGDVEIIVHQYVFDHTGDRIATFTRGAQFSFPLDVDDDGDLEVIVNFSAWQHDGSEAWNNETLGDGILTYTAAADVDGDGRPEIIGVDNTGTTRIEHDGSIAELQGTHAISPPALSDTDADGAVEIQVANIGNQLRIYNGQFAELASTPITEGAGHAGVAAFDFSGDGSSETIFGDETRLGVFDDALTVEIAVDRTSWTNNEYAVVADVDNDGSAEILVTSAPGDEGQTSPTLQMIGSPTSAWMPARRVWNQHAYMVTNVGEFGEIPQQTIPHWVHHNGFRRNAQVNAETGELCVPTPP